MPGFFTTESDTKLPPTSPQANQKLFTTQFPSKETKEDDELNFDSDNEEKALDHIFKKSVVKQ